MLSLNVNGQSHQIDVTFGAHNVRYGDIAAAAQPVPQNVARLLF
jgi:hypothetical protein